MPKEYTVLSEALTHHTLALFIGADLPREVTGLPSRADLARELARRKGLDASLPLAEVTQRVSQAGNRWDFTDFIRNALDATGKSPQSFHQRVVAVLKEHQIETIITSAYDNLLELAFQQAGVGINPVVRGSDVSFINPDRPTLVKLYGDAQQPDTLVATDRDHSALLRDRDKEALVDEVRRAFRRNTVLFIGYNLADPDFRFLFDEIAESRFARHAYAVWSGLPETDIQMWQDRGIVIIDADPLEVLTDLLGASRSSESAIHTPDDIALAKVDEMVYDFIERFDEVNVIAQVLDPSVGVRVWDECYCGGEIKRAIFAHPDRLDGCKFKYTIRGFPATIRSVRLDFFIGIPDKSEFPKDDSIGFEIHVDGKKRWSKQWNKKKWDHNSIEGIEIGPDRTLEVMFVTDDLGRNEHNWAVWGSPVLVVEELEITTVPELDEGIHLISRSATLSIGGTDMDYKRGFAQLKECLEHKAPGTFTEFSTLEERFRKNERAERLFGSSENTRNEHSQIIYALNELALQHCGISFNDLCLGKQILPKSEPAPKTQEIIERLDRIEERLKQGREEDRQTANQILEALAQDRIAQDEVTQAVAELHAWAQSVEHSGFPLSPELQEALDALSEHTGSAYQYLQLALPIIPGILSYNVELGSQHQLDLRVVWEGIKTRLGKGAKGDDTTAGSETTYYGTGKAWAVLVGVNEYEDEVHYGRLQVCVKDVEAIRDQLVASGVERERVHLLVDQADDLPTRDNILVTLTAVAKATEPDDLLLFYYSGHGDEDGGESYLVARNGKKLALEDTAVRVSRVKQIMEQARARAKVIVLDACHSGANISGKGPQKMTEEFIRRVFEQAAGLVILASCQQGEVSYEWRENDRSVFTHFLLEALEGQADLDEKGFVTVQDANRHVTNGVRLWASQRKLSQTPTLQAAVAGDIILARYQ